MAKASLRELMGNKVNGHTMSLNDLPELLGEKLPEMPKNGVGRLRLMRALQQRFGQGFRNIPGVKGLIKEFDEEVEFERKLASLKVKKEK